MKLALPNLICTTLIRGLLIKTTLSYVFVLCSNNVVNGQENVETPSTAKECMQTMLSIITVDSQGPTVQARNLFHMSIAMYDAWTVFNDGSQPYLVGKQLGTFTSEFDGFPTSGMNLDSAQNVAIRYAGLRLAEKRFRSYPTNRRTMDSLYVLFEQMGFDYRFNSTDYQSGSPAALGNYIAEEVIRFGRQDGSYEEERHEPRYYNRVNRELQPDKPGNPTITDPNRWQPLEVQAYVDQKGLDPTLPGWNHLLIRDQAFFTTPEWGNVYAFALEESDKQVYDRDGAYQVYNDPGAPPLLSKLGNDISSEQYKYGFSMVAVWSGLADPTDSVWIDISPGALGSQPTLPENFAQFDRFYNYLKGGVKNRIPHSRNPSTGKPYKPNLVLRGDYIRVIAEYWVDAVNTFSPPGHWIDLLHQTSYFPGFLRKWKGKGRKMSALEWDVKSYFTMAGAMHDASISCWGIKGYYDYIRPISAIRYMAQKGQSTDSLLPNFHPHGIPLIPEHIEVVTETDPIVGDQMENLNKIKLWAWKGPDSVKNVYTDVAGVGWILAENWWPYQRYSFATPTFAGYTSGHSTYSPAGAEILTLITGDPYFPNGMATFTAKKNEFLEFEEGPSMDVTLQWATYHDAAAETCLSRIYGGIHPPADDIPGRKIGIKVARKALQKAETLFGK